MESTHGKEVDMRVNNDKKASVKRLTCCMLSEYEGETVLL